MQEGIFIAVTVLEHKCSAICTALAVVRTLVLLSLQVSSLKNRLKKVSTTTGDGVSRAFLKAQAALFGSYRNALQIEPVRDGAGEPIESN